MQKFDDIEKYNNAFVNLALPFFGFSDPIKSKEIKHNNKTYNIWDYFEIKNDITLKELFDIFEKEHNIEIDMLAYDVVMLYSFFLSPKTKQKRMNMKISDLIKSISKKDLDKEMIMLNIMSDDSDDLPSIKYYLREQPKIIVNKSNNVI